jgi:hypothetical protein
MHAAFVLESGRTERCPATFKYCQRRAGILASLPRDEPCLCDDQYSTAKYYEKLLSTDISSCN